MSNNDFSNIPDKANRLLKMCLLVFVLIALRIWILAVHEREEKTIEGRKMGRKTEVISPRRATIRDRFNEPFALNKLKYEAAITYADIKEIPSRGNQRKNYIKQLSRFLAKKLSLDEERLEDEIHAKASLFNTIPYVIKEGLSEEEYLSLKSASLFWPGLTLKRNASRYYPQGKTACHVLGTLGMISKEEYEAKVREREELKFFLEGLELGADLPLPEGFPSILSVKKRARELDELAYTVIDSVGKSGIEAFFEQTLRGYKGKKTILYDNKGHLIKNYPGSRDEVPGQRLLLSLSLELQKEAERLLILAEDCRETRVKIEDKGTIKADKVPWIKGGALIAIDPNTGEILAFASHPRFDPNEFVKTGQDMREKSGEVLGMLEEEPAIKDLWNGIRPLKRDRYHVQKEEIFEEEAPITWGFFLDQILSTEGEAKKGILEIKNLDKGKQALKNKDLNPYVRDLILLNFDPSKYSDPLFKKVGKFTLDEQRENEQAWAVFQEGLREVLKPLYHASIFKEWRKENEKTFIRQKRLEEKEGKKYPRPYLDYLDDKEKEFFHAFWEEKKLEKALSLLTDASSDPDLSTLRKEILAGAHSNLFWIKSFHILNKALKNLSPDLAKEYLLALRSFDELNQPLDGPWKRLKRAKKPFLQHHLAAAFYPSYGYGFSRSFAYRQACIQGSIFKLITAYVAMNQKGLNPLEMKDQIFKMGSHVYLGYDQYGKPIPQLYKGGRLPRSSSSHLGELDLLGAIENSSNPYFSLLASDIIKSPDDLIEGAKAFGFGEKTGIQLPGEIQGHLPTDLATNRTGLYATAIGQHSLVVTPLQTSLMLSSLANGGALLRPQIIKLKAGDSSEKIDEIPPLSSYPLDMPLFMAGIDFPLFTSLLDEEKGKPIKVTRSLKRRSVPLSEPIRKTLLLGMRRVVHKTLNDSIFNLSKLYHSHPELIASYMDLKPTFIGKTSTAEACERLNLDLPDEKPLYTHVWFGGISFEDETFKKPELVVIAYLRYGGFGKEAAPLAAQLVKKWREIKNEAKNN